MIGPAVPPLQHVRTKSQVRFAITWNTPAQTFFSMTIATATREHHLKTGMSLNGAHISLFLKAVFFHGGNKFDKALLEILNPDFLIIVGKEAASGEEAGIFQLCRTTIKEF